jgi:hypothetical protein
MFEKTGEAVASTGAVPLAVPLVVRSAHEAALAVVIWAVMAA